MGEENIYSLISQQKNTILNFLKNQTKQKKPNSLNDRVDTKEHFILRVYKTITKKKSFTQKIKIKAFMIFLPISVTLSFKAANFPSKFFRFFFFCLQLLKKSSQFLLLYLFDCFFFS